MTCASPLWSEFGRGSRCFVLAQPMTTVLSFEGFKRFELLVLTVTTQTTIVFRCSIQTPTIDIVRSNDTVKLVSLFKFCRFHNGV